MEIKPCEIVDGFCRRHATWHPQDMVALCLEESERGEKVRLVLDGKFKNEIAEFQKQGSLTPQKKSCKGCNGGTTEAITQAIQDRLSGGRLRPVIPPRKGCTRCGQASRTK